MIIPLLMVILCLDVIAKSEKVVELVFMCVRVTVLVLSFLATTLKLFGLNYNCIIAFYCLLLPSS